MIVVSPKSKYKKRSVAFDLTAADVQEMRAQRRAGDARADGRRQVATGRVEVCV